MVLLPQSGRRCPLQLGKLKLLSVIIGTRPGYRYLCVVAALLVVGCGGSNSVVVSGTLKQNQKTYTPAEGEQVMVSFMQLKDGKSTGQVFPARLEPSGGFTIVGPDNKGIAVGKYRVIISSLPARPTPGEIFVDKFQETYGLNNSSLEVDVSPSSRSITLDLK